MNEHAELTRPTPTSVQPPAPDPAGAGIVTTLATLPPAAHLDVDALARILGRHRKSLERAVRRGELPPSVRLLGKPVWIVGTILRHLEARQAEAVRRASRRGVVGKSA